MQSFTIGKNQAGQRFDKFLVKYLPGAPKSLIYKMLRKKNITLNKHRSDGSDILSEGDIVESFFSDETFEKFSAGDSIQSVDNRQKAKQSDLYPTVIYEDEDIIILDKPAGMLSQKAEEKDVSVNEWLIDYLLKNEKITHDELKTFRPSVCNRLDRNTSGLIICGVSLAGLQKMSEIIREGKIEKYYVTLCHGRFEKPKKVSGILIKDNSKNISKIKNTLNDDENANILTEFKPLKLFRDATLLEVNLHTGKPHQIRAQLYSLGHPVYGDRKYGDGDKGLKHQLLCAYRIVFPGKDIMGERFSKLSGKEIMIDYPKLIKQTMDKL